MERKLSNECLLDFFKYLCTPAIVSLISFIYIFQIQPVFQYTGMTINRDVNIFYMFQITLIATLVLLFSPKRIYLPSSIFSWLIYSLVFVPSLVISYISGITVGFDHIVLVITLTFSMMIIFILPKFTMYKSIRVTLDENLFKFLVIFFGIICYLIIFKYYKPGTSNLLNLKDVSELYDIRGDFRDSASNAPVFARYIFAWTSKIFVPFVFVYGLAKKNIYIILGSIFTAIMLFSSTGLKSIILGPILIFGFWYLLSRRKIYFSTLSIILFSVLILGATLQDNGVPLFNYVIIRRVVIVPGFLTGCYFDFFSNNQFSMLGYSILKGIVTYSYQDTPPYIIGSYCFGRSDMSANTNFLASAYGDFGVLGCILFAYLTTTMFCFLDKVACKKNAIPEISAMLLLPTWTLIDTALFTSLLTHGLGIVVLLLIIIPSNLFNSKNIKV